MGRPLTRSVGGAVEPALHRYDAVQSTMDLLHQLAEAGAPAGTAVAAVEQTAGRGSRGRRWQSPRGGLWLSVLLRPSRRGTELVSLRAGLAIAAALERGHPDLRIGIKWPNDLIWGDRKIGGVLCEGRWSGELPAWTAVGVGLNIRNPIPVELAEGAVALVEAIPAVTVESVLDLVLPSLRELDDSSSRLSAGEQSELDRRDSLRGRALAEPIAGTAAGIGADGALLVRVSDGRTAELRTGSVRLAPSGGFR